VKAIRAMRQATIKVVSAFEDTDATFNEIECDDIFTGKE
jgi:hypothetical protein